MRLQRDASGAGCTPGRLFVDGVHECFTLEDTVRLGAKVPGETAIPAGRYRVAVTWSARFQRQLPLLLDVPGFTGIRIHAGNVAGDTAGCLLVGLGRAVDSITGSRLALQPLQAKIARALTLGGAVWIAIVPAKVIRNAWT